MRSFEITKRRLGVTAAVAVGGTVLAFMLGGCDPWNDERGKGDAPVGDRHESHRQVWENINDFPNVVAWCIGENGVYTTGKDYEGDSMDVIPEDPNCKPGGILYVAPQTTG